MPDPVDVYDNALFQPISRDTIVGEHENGELKNERAPAFASEDESF
jgi:hypothetical protein